MHACNDGTILLKIIVLGRAKLLQRKCVIISFAAASPSLLLPSPEGRGAQHGRNAFTDFAVVRSVVRFAATAAKWTPSPISLFYRGKEGKLFWRMEVGGMLIHQHVDEKTATSLYVSCKKGVKNG